MKHTFLLIFKHFKKKIDTEDYMEYLQIHEILKIELFSISHSL